jgi:hypothetical protein
MLITTDSTIDGFWKDDGEIALDRFIGLTSINPRLISNTSSGLMSGASGPLSEAVNVTPLTPELSIFR